MTERLTRRKFMGQCTFCGLGAACSAMLPMTATAAWRNWKRNTDISSLKEASFWEPLPGGRVRCLTCPNECVRDEGDVTTCRTRINRGGKLYSLTYNKPCVIFQDPLEKNPLYHVSPGSKSLGIGTAGCNLRCLYCQNWSFSQSGPGQTRNMDVTPEQLVRRATDRGLSWITFSYTEPVAYLEYALDVASVARKAGIRIAVSTSGYIHKEPLQALMDCCDAFSITLKGYSEEFYRDVIGCSRNDVWRMIAMLAQSETWLEIVNLIVPTMNDEDRGFRSIAKSLARLNPQIPLHFLRFSPAYKLQNLPPTPRKTLERAKAIAGEEGIKYVYLANVPGHNGANTYCPSCGKLLIERSGFKVLRNEVTRGQCPACKQAIPGVDLG